MARACLPFYEVHPREPVETSRVDIEIDAFEGLFLAKLASPAEMLVHDPATRKDACHDYLLFERFYAGGGHVEVSDTAYGSAATFAAAEGRGVYTVIPTQRQTRGRVPLSRFRYDAIHDVLRCPEGRHLKPGARVARGRFYRAKVKDCKTCRLAADSVSPTARKRSIIVQDGHCALLRARRRLLKKLPRDRAAYISHRIRVDGRHGDAKTCHGLHRAVRRGLGNVSIQCWLTAAAINLKRLANAVSEQLRKYYVLTRRSGAFVRPLSRLMEAIPVVTFDTTVIR